MRVQISARPLATVAMVAGMEREANFQDPAQFDDSLWSLQQLAASPQLFEHFVYGLALVDQAGGLLYMNCKARELLALTGRRRIEAEWTCCDLICTHTGPFDGGCLAERAGESDDPLPEVRIDVNGDHGQGAAWVAVSKVETGVKTLFHLRPGARNDRRRRSHPEWPASAQAATSELYISTLGRFRAEGGAGPLDGEWLGQRPGQLLKYLVCERGQLVTNEMIAEALWPEAGQSEASNRARHYVHVLREKLEPERSRNTPSRFIIARRGGYHLDTNLVRVDADEFEREARAGLTAFVQGQIEPAADQIDKALRLYREPFFAEDPYEEWTLEERERLHELAGRALRAQVRIKIELREFDSAAVNARQLADMEPFDMDAQRMVLDLCIRRGRRSEAFRRYSVLRKRMLQSFGQEPDFDLAELEGQFSPIRE